jgi:Icc-related predicted phosphoesterase
MKIVFISDTHTQHTSLTEILPQADCICFCGDLMSSGYNKNEIQNFLIWFNSLNYKHKIFIAGNHDRFIQNNPSEFIDMLTDFSDLIYLQDSEVIIDGLKFYGSPWQPWFYDWAFNLKTTEELFNKWELIPEDTDILLTHGPSYGILDKTKSGELVGCKQLTNRIKKIKPKIHAFGHIHEAYGLEYLDVDGHKIRCINASVLNERYWLTNNPIVIEL